MASRLNETVGRGAAAVQDVVEVDAAEAKRSRKIAKRTEDEVVVLPAGWEQAWSEKQSRVYYFNTHQVFSIVAK